MDDETLPRELPEGWQTTGWEVTLPGSGGGLMDMLGGLMGGGNEAPKTWMATTGSDAYELITPRLQARKGDVLRFQAELGGGGMMAMMGAFMGGGASGQLNVFYSLDNGDSWTYYNTFVQNGLVHFVAPYSGIYQLRFTSPSASVDNFYGFRTPIEGIAFHDGNDKTNAEVMEQYDGQTVNICYDRVLSASDNGNGTFTPCAYTICLPYDIDFSEYAGQDKVKLYQLSLIDNHYHQFIFTRVADKAVAGQAYLAVVERGNVRMDAVGATLKSSCLSSSTKHYVNDYEDWYFNDKLTHLGQWTGSFSAISATEADAMNIFCLLSDGSWARFTSDDDDEAQLKAFRAYYLASNATEESAGVKANVPANQKANAFRTLFSNEGLANMSDSRALDAQKMLFDADIPTPSSVTTGINPVGEDSPFLIQTIEADGTNRYFDLQGRMLSGKPHKGLYIVNGKKVIR